MAGLSVYSLGAALCLTLAVLSSSSLGQQLVESGGFEEPTRSKEWKSFKRSTLSLDGDSFEGSQSLKVSQRTNRWAGVTQKLAGNKFRPDSMYLVCTAFKILTPPASALGTMLRVRIKVRGDSGTNYNKDIGKFKYIHASGRWRELCGDFVTPNEGIAYAQYTVYVADKGVDYLMDDVSITEIPEDPDLVQSTDAAIDDFRKEDLTISVTLPANTPSGCDLDVQVKQTQKEMGFGCAIQTNAFNGDEDRRLGVGFGERYRTFNYEHFNWLSPRDSLKWLPYEPTEGEPKFERVEETLDHLDNHNIKARGHSVFWGRTQNNPGWVQTLTGNALKAAMANRINSLFEKFAGRLVQWDVNNEGLQAKHYESATGDANITQWAFDRVHQADPNAKLYLNEYQTLRNSALSWAIVDQAEEMRASGIPVHGLGLQGHIRTNIRPELLRNRLAIASKSDFDVSITELSIHENDVHKRGQQLTEAYRIFYANPKVKLINLWGASDQGRTMFEPETVLFEGPNFTPNAAGSALQSLLREWTTDETLSIKSNIPRTTTRVFEGTHDVKILRNGVEVGSASVVVTNGSPVELAIPVATDLTGLC